MEGHKGARMVPDGMPRKKFSPPQPSGYEGLMFPPEQSSKYAANMPAVLAACKNFLN